MGDEHSCLKACEVIAEIERSNRAINARLDQVIHGNSQVIELLDQKLTELLKLLGQVMTNRDMIPISSFKQLAIWMMVVMFALQFGIFAVEKLIFAITKTIGG